MHLTEQWGQEILDWDLHALLNFSGVDQITFFLSMHWKSCGHLPSRFFVCAICLVKTEEQAHIFMVTFICMHGPLAQTSQKPVYSSVLNSWKNLQICTSPFCVWIPFTYPLLLSTFSCCSIWETRANWALNLNMWHQKTRWQRRQGLDHPQSLWLPSNWMWTELDAASNRYPRAFINHTRTKCICGQF